MSKTGFVLLLAAFVALAGCTSKFKRYDGPEVTRIVVFKDARRMYLMSGEVALRTFEFELGFAPVGDKAIEGDGKTPEGEYIIDRRNPDSKYHLSLGISYPSKADIEEARALGQSPGGEIFIHGTPDRFLGGDDWTWGCIAVTNDEIEDIYAMVRDGTPIVIHP